MTRFGLVAAVVLVTLFGPLVSPARAGKVEKTVPFSLDKWFELGSKDGEVEIRRIQVERQAGKVTKSTFLRPGNTEYLETVQIRIEYSNRDRKKDWDAHLDIAWLDASGAVIDGYRDEENIDSDTRNGEIHVTLSTLRYGLEKARNLRVRIEYEPE